jgi:hypothetical protein
VTQTFSPLTIAKALNAAEVFTGPYELVGTTTEQRSLVQALPAYYRRYNTDSYGFAAATADEINAQLARAGFDIRLHCWSESLSNFGIAGITDVTVNWQTPGGLTTIAPDSGERYPGFILGSAQASRIVKIDEFLEPIVQVFTVEGLDLRIVIAPEPDSQLNLMRTARILHEADISHRDIVAYSACIPMVKLDEQPDISWLVGLSLKVASGPAWQVVQARQQVKFGMNQYGARAREATAAAVMKGISHERHYIVDRPFLVTIGLPDLDVPLFGAYITPESWADPGNLSAL